MIRKKPQLLHIIFGKQAGGTSEKVVSDFFNTIVLNGGSHIWLLHTVGQIQMRKSAFF